MTTIAATATSMAGDGQETCNGTIVGSDAVKVSRLRSGALFGAAGSACDSDIVAAWIEAGEEGEPPRVNDDFGALLLMPDGRLRQCGSTVRFIDLPPPCAMGSGMDYAIGAMDAGASAEKAVLIATRRDPRSGGKITTLHLESEKC